MKKIITLILSVLIVATLVFMLVGCGDSSNKLSGTYEGNGLSLSFSGDSVTVEISELGARYRLVGEYEIKTTGEKQSIKFSFKDIDEEGITEGEVKVLQKLESFGNVFADSPQPLYREEKSIRISLLNFTKK